MTHNSVNSKPILNRLNAVLSENEVKPQSAEERKFIQELINYVKRVLLYHDQKLRDAVNKVVPVKDLLEKAMQKRAVLKNESKLDVNTRDLFLVELLAWFKHSFFSWFDVPVCCNLKMSFVSYDQPSVDEIKSEASRVETYVCSACGLKSRFPRYNDPLKLLETRQGRCGEWANCFCAILHSLDYEVRFIVDWTDHVWVEVYNETEKRWIHCDPCENAIDTPLMYEHGWNKSLIYCIAFSMYEIQDVTWRYTTKIVEVMQRRRAKCRETWIIAVLLKSSEVLQQHFSKDEKETFCIRRLNELVSFLSLPNQQKKIKDGELQGRQSGSLLWRIQRGELSLDTKPAASFTFEMSPGNNAVSYNCVKDEYVFGGKTWKGWSTCVHQFRNVFRKVESDWNMCYLSRQESSIPREGFIEWNINLSKIKWTCVEIFILCETYSNAEVELSAVALPENKKLSLKSRERHKLERSSISGCEFLVIRAELRGGTSGVGWQQAQLFRQSLVTDRDKNTFEINVTMN